jgi:putative transposase
VGVDVGVRVLATVADQHGEVLDRVPNPRPLEAALKELRHLSRERSRRTQGSCRYAQTQQKLTRLHGNEARKGPSQQAGKQQPRGGMPMSGTL